jgi:hypothetical protein
LLSFLIGVTAAVALGGFNPLTRFTRSYRHQPHSLSAPMMRYESNGGCRMRSRTRTADLRDDDFEPSNVPPPPAVPAIPEVPLDEKDAPKPPRAPRPKH